jgi:hypothetical protein
MRVSAYLTGGDPVPGEAGEIRRVTDHLRSAVTAAEAAGGVLQSVGVEDGMWTGRAADEWASKRGELQKRLTTANQAYTDAQLALERWLRELQAAQDEAARIAAQADEIMRQQPPADPSTAFTPLPGTGVPAPVQGLQKRRDALADRARRDAERCADEIRRAAEAVGRYQDSWWENTKEILAHASELLDAVTPWLGLAAIFFPALTPFVLGLSIAKLAIDVVLAVDGDGSWGKVALGAAGVGLGVAGAVGGNMSRAAQQTTRFNAAGFTDDAARVSGRSSIGGAVRQLGHDAVHPVAAHRDRAAIDAALTRANAHLDVPPITSWTSGPAGAWEQASRHYDAYEAGSSVGGFVSGRLGLDREEAR